MGNRKDPEAQAPEAEVNTGAVLYGIEDVPSPPLLFLFGLQQAIMTIGGTLSIPFIISGLICTGGQPEVTSTLLSITMFMCGIATVLQCIFGVRLGIIQGGSHTFIAPIVAMMSVGKWACPDTDSSSNNGTAFQYTDEVWQSRMREIQGNLAVASVTQIVIGSTGFVGVLLQFIGPLTIAPTIALIGLSLTGVVMEFNKANWGVAGLSMALTLLFTLYMNRIKLPLPSWNRNKGCRIVGYPIFQLFPVILSICFSWLFCYILTVTDTLTDDPTKVGYAARTDARLDVLDRAPWFYWPYPFQFGTPTVSAGGYVAFLAATLSSIVESIGDYFAAARISGAPAPPPHAVNRGITMEGIASVVSGLVGAGHGTTSYSGNIGAIGITKVASRSVFIVAGVILVVCGVIGKLGAVITLIPDPVIGGTLTVVFGMVTAVGISSLQFMDLSSTRNLTIVGVSLILGLMVPQFVNDPANVDAIQTGSERLDQMIKVLLGTSMFVGGFVGCFLDNTVPGTIAERGIVAWRTDAKGFDAKATSTMYDLPLISGHFRRANCCSYVPISPSFDKAVTIRAPKCCSRRRRRDSDPQIYSNGGYDNKAAHINDVEVSVSKPSSTKL